MFRLDRKLAAVAAVAAVVIITSGAAYGAYTVSGGDTRPDVARRARGATSHDASLQLGCATPAPGVRCEPPAEEPRLTCEDARACVTPTVEPELTCEEADACATPETECHGDVCFTPPLPPACPPNARCIAPSAGVYSCARQPGGGILCTMPVVDPIPPCPLMPPVEGDAAPPAEPACPPPCGAPVPMPGGDAQTEAMPACPLPCDAPAPMPDGAQTLPFPACPWCPDVPAPQPPTGAAPQALIPECAPPCLADPAPEPPTGIEPRTVAPACIPSCPVPAPSGPGAEPDAMPRCPQPLPPDCVISSDGSVACPGASAAGGSGGGTSGVATAVPGIIEPTMQEYASD